MKIDNVKGKNLQLADRVDSSWHTNSFDEFRATSGVAMWTSRKLVDEENDVYVPFEIILSK